MNKFVKYFGLCMVGFVGGGITVGYGFLKVLTKSENAFIGFKKDIIFNIEKLLYGKERDSFSYTSRVSYARMTEPYTNINNVVLRSRKCAEDILCNMLDIIYEYGYATVADFLDLVVPSKTYKDDKYGWTSLDTAKIVRTRDGYQIKLPRPVPVEGR